MYRRLECTLGCCISRISRISSSSSELSTKLVSGVTRGSGDDGVGAVLSAAAAVLPSSLLLGLLLMLSFVS